MNTEQRNNLLSLAIKLLKCERKGMLKGRRANHEFKMSHFIGDGSFYNECGTTCCALGFYAIEMGDKAPKNKFNNISWDDLSVEEFGIHKWTDSWEYLFGQYNPNCVKAFAHRVLKHVSGIDCPSINNKKDLIFILNKYKV